MATEVLRGEGLTRCYGDDDLKVTALADADFSVYRGEFIVVLGPSGSGKSTLLNILGGMDKPTAGKLWYDGRDLATYSQEELAGYRRNVVGFVFQFFNLLPSLTAQENVELAASIVKGSMKSAEVLDMVGLGDRCHHFPAQLSGGEQQRVAIARAIVKRPSLLLCDEPTGALDSKNSVAVIRLLAEVGKSLDCPVMVITHNHGVAAVAHRVFYMRDGRIDKQETNSSPISPEDISW